MSFLDKIFGICKSKKCCKQVSGENCNCEEKENCCKKETPVSAPAPEATPAPEENPQA